LLNIHPINANMDTAVFFLDYVSAILGREYLKKFIL